MSLQNIIISATGCTVEDASKVEDIMRDLIFKSTLDWQTHEELAEAAATAYAFFQEHGYEQ